MKKNINRAVKLALLATAGVASHAMAGSTDLVLGITGNGATSDAVFDLGSAASVGVGGTAVVDLIDSRGAGFSETGLSGAQFQSILSATFGSGIPNGANLTVAGGQNGLNTFFYATEDRGAAGANPGLAL